MTDKTIDLKEKKIEKEIKKAEENGDHVFPICKECVTNQYTAKLDMFTNITQYAYDMLENSPLDVLHIISVLEDIKMELYKEHIMCVIEDRFEIKEKEEDHQGDNL